MAATVGQKAPEFKLLNDKREEVTLSSQKGHPVVLAFFPAAFTGVCTKELCTFRDSMAKLNSANAQVYGISVDTTFVLAEFKKQQNLNFPLLADNDKKAAKTFGVVMPKHENFTQRVTFVIDKQGIIRKIYPTVDVRKHPDEVLSYIRENLK